VPQGLDQHANHGRRLGNPRDENGIHVFTINGSVAESALVVDTYSREDGSYPYSVKIQKDLRRIRTLRDVHVGIENDTSVTAYWYRFTS